jgi:hypothetical protein
MDNRKIIYSFFKYYSLILRQVSLMFCYFIKEIQSIRFKKDQSIDAITIKDRK